MHVLSGIGGESQNFQGGTLTIGNFDGLHRGHQKLLAAVKSGPGPYLVLTFEPHPIQVLFPEKRQKALFPREDLVEQLPRYGIDLLVRLAFTREFAAQTAEQFIANAVVGPFRPRRLVVGYDFAFGSGRSGNLEWLTTWSKSSGVEVVVVDALLLQGEIVSSRSIREMIQRGEVEKACEWLGRPYYVRGRVERGAGRGRTIGVPTLNQSAVNETLPVPGVYATQARTGAGVFKSVTNVGYAPTFQSDGALTVETHLLEQALDLYGQTVDVDFHRFLRPEMKFRSAEDLKKQIEKDILEAKRVLE